MLELATALGLGGVIGAIAAVLYQGARLPESFRLFTSALETCLAGRDDESCANVRRRFDELQKDVGLFLAAVDKARRLLRIRT